MKRKHLIMILASVFFMTILLSILGVIFNKTDYEKQQGFTGVYDVSSGGMIAYVVYEKGKPGLYLQHDVQEFQNPVLQLDIYHKIPDINFSPDGSSLAYIVGNKSRKLDPETLVLSLEIETMEQKRLFSEQGLIAEISFDPKDADLLFYLRAGTYESHSPNDSTYGFDLFSYRISEGEKTRYTELEQYSMESLNISSSDNVVFMQMDDTDVETEEEPFETNHRIFRIPIDQPEDISVVSKQDRTTDIYDFVIVPGKNEVIFQSASTTNKKGTYEYELYHYDVENAQERQLTYLKESAGRPIISPQNNKVFFMVDKQFGKGYDDYRLYQMDIDGNNQEEIKLDGLVDE